MELLTGFSFFFPRGIWVAHAISSTHFFFFLDRLKTHMVYTDVKSGKLGFPCGKEKNRVVFLFFFFSRRKWEPSIDSQTAVKGTEAATS